MHHFHGTGAATGGRAQGLRIRGGVFVILAVWAYLWASLAGGTGGFVHVLFQTGTSMDAPAGVRLMLGANVELTSAPRGGRKFDEGDAERQVSRRRAVAETSATRFASGTVPSLSVGASVGQAEK